MNDERISKDEYLICMAWVASLRSEDPSRKVGCVCANKSNRILSTGYNGLPSEFKAPEDYWTGDTRLKMVMHSEQNALLLCTPGTVHTLAVTCLPCSECAKLIVNHGVRRVLYSTPYERGTDALDIFNFYQLNYLHIPFNCVADYFQRLLVENCLSSSSAKI